MATAEKTTVEREVITTETDTVVKLELSETEAHALAVVLSRVAGGFDTARGDTDGIGRALASAGYAWLSLPLNGHMTGGVRFHKTPQGGRAPF